MGGVAVERWTPERRRELTRTALLEAAAQVFARRGFYGASLDEIAATAGFTRGAIYKNFEDKEGLFLAAIERRAQHRLAAFSAWFDERLEQGVWPASHDPAELAKAFRQIMAPDPEWYALDLEARLYALRNPEFKERYIANYRKTTEAVARFMEDLAAAGFPTRLPSDRLAHVLEVAAEGFVAWTHLDPDDDQLFEAFSELVLAGVIDLQTGGA
jgi:AcrR family transcriptional regulator